MLPLLIPGPFLTQTPRSDTTTARHGRILLFASCFVTFFRSLKLAKGATSTGKTSLLFLSASDL